MQWAEPERWEIETSMLGGKVPFDKNDKPVITLLIYRIMAVPGSAVPSSGPNPQAMHPFQPPFQTPDDGHGQTGPAQGVDRLALVQTPAFSQQEQ